MPRTPSLTTHSPRLFVALLALIAMQRLAELARSRRHEARLIAAGGTVHAGADWGAMVALHVGWLAASAAEVVVLGRALWLPLATAAGVALLTGQGLRFAAMHTLGTRWTVRVVTLPGAPPVRRGVYRLVRHPNYLGVALEIAAVPLLHGAYLTAVVFSLLDAAVLAMRIRREEAALEAAGDYRARLGDRPRLLPFVGGVGRRARPGR